MIELHTLDYTVIGFYFVFILFIGFLESRRTKKRGVYGTQDYFLASRNLPWYLIGASLFAAGIGSEHLVGLAGSGFAGGVPVAHFENLAAFILLLLGWVFVPIYLKTGVFTMPEFLQKRYSSSSRTYLTIVTLISYVLTKISVIILAGGIIFEVLGIPFWQGAFILVLATGAYTVAGGMKAIVYAEAAQLFVLLAGSFLVTLFGLKYLGGWDAMITTVKSTNPEYFSFWRDMHHPDFPWTGILLGAPILAIWYWCTDQFIVQRVLSARGVDDARKGTIAAGFLKQLPLFIFVLPGIVAFALYQQGILSMPVAGAGVDSNYALPMLIKTVLPIGVRGVVIAGLFAALMSSLSATFNASSTLFTLDIYKRFRKHTTEKELVRVGRIATALIVVLGLLWIPFIKLFSGQLFVYLQSIQAYISPPIACVFLLGIFYKRLNATGAIVTLWTGFVFGIGRIISEVLVSSHIVTGGFIEWYTSINFLHFAFILFVLCSVVLLGVSMLGAKPSAEKLAVMHDRKVKSGFGFNATSIATVLLICSVLAVWTIFR